MLKSLLVNPPVFDPGRYRRALEEKPIETYTMPIGLGYIAAVLAAEGYEVRAVDAYNSSWDDLRKIVAEYAPEVIGISCLTDQRASVYRLIALAKELLPRVRVVLGGSHATLMYDQLLRNYPVDAVVLGEGEYTFLELLKAWDQGSDLSSVKGLAFMSQGEVVLTEKREPIQDLDTIPFPSYEFFDLDMYSGWELHRKVASALDDTEVHRQRSAALVTSRGCPWNCSFCSVTPIWGRKWRARSAQNVVDEIEMLVTKYGCKIIDFVDDIFSLDQQRVIDISDEILKRNLDIHWGFETGVKCVSEEMLQKAAAAGCRFIIYGVESASRDVMQNVSRKTDAESIVKTFEWTRRAGIAVGAFIMAGNPGESDHSIRETLEMLRKLKPDVLVSQILMVFPGNAQYAKAKEEGFLDDRYWLTELPAPYYEQHTGLRQLVSWHRKLGYYRCGAVGTFVRAMRDLLELRWGVRLCRSGVRLVPPVPDKSLWRTEPPQA